MPRVGLPFLLLSQSPGPQPLPMPAQIAAPADAPDSQSLDVVRFATFNASLNRNFAGQLVSDLSTPNNVQAKTVAEIIQRTRPDVLLINEFDFVENGVAARLFQENYLSRPQNGAEPIEYDYFFVAASNTKQFHRVGC